MDKTLSERIRLANKAQLAYINLHTMKRAHSLGKATDDELESVRKKALAAWEELQAFDGNVIEG